MKITRFASRLTQRLGGILTLLVLASCVVGAQTTKKPAPAKAAAAASHGPSAAARGPITDSTTHGPTTAGHGPTTAGHGPTTVSRGPTTTAHSPTTAGGRVTETGHGPTATSRGPAVANRAGTPMPRGSQTVRNPRGDEIRTRANGRPADVHIAGRGMDIHHGLDGSRRVSVERADHSRIVADRRGRGYVQHPYMYRGHEFAHRTYYRDGRAYDRFYRRYQYHGVYVEAYAPAVYYAPAFYGWAYNPWSVGVAFSWGVAR